MMDSLSLILTVYLVRVKSNVKFKVKLLMRIILVFLWYVIGARVLICIVHLSLQIWSTEKFFPFITTLIYYLFMLIVEQGCYRIAG